MPRPKKYLFIDTAFNDYVHHCLLSLTQADKKFLSEQEVLKIQPGRSLRMFCTDSPLEEKLLILAKTGFRFFIVLHPRSMTKMELKDWYKQYQKDGNRRDIIEGMAKDKLFVLGSPQMLLAHYFLHQNCASDFYKLNRHFQKIYQLWQMAGQNLGSWRKEDDIKEISAGAEYLLETSFKVKKMDGIFVDLGLGTDTDFVILQHLMRQKNRNTFIEDKLIFNDCNNGKWKMKAFARRLAWLAQFNFIVQMPNRKYAIADKGIIVVMEYLKKLAEHVKFEL